LKGLKIEEGLFWDYWLTDEGIFKVKILSKKLFAMMYVPLFVALVIIGILWGGVGFLIIAFVIAYVMASWTASSRRRRIVSLTPEELIREGIVEEKVPWSDVDSVEFTGKKLIIRWRNEELKVGVRKRDFEYVRKFLEPKIGEKLKITEEVKK